MVDRYGQKITGRNYLEFIPERRREKTYELLSHIITQPCAMLVRIRTATNVDQQIEFNETVGLPFFNKNGELNLVMYYTVNEDYDRLETDPNQRVMEHLPTERIYFDIGAGVPEWEDEPYPIGEGN